MLIQDIQVEAEKRDRNRMITIESPLGGDIVVSCMREIVLVKDGSRFQTGNKYGEKNYSIRKKLSDISGMSVTLPPEAGGVTLNVAQLTLAIEMITDSLAVSTSGVSGFSGFSGSA